MSSAFIKTALAAATAKGEGLILHEAWLETMTRFFAERGRPMAAVELAG